MDTSALLMTTPNVWSWSEILSTLELLFIYFFLHQFDRGFVLNVCAGAEHASITMRTNIHLAQTQVEQSQKLSADADKKLTETRVMEIERMAQHAASSDEEEVPDAYLREDWVKTSIWKKWGKWLLRCYPTLWFLLSHVTVVLGHTFEKGKKWAT